MTSKGKKKTKEEVERELGLREQNENSNALWDAFTNAIALVADKVLFTDEYWEGFQKPKDLAWGSLKTPIRNRLFAAVKKELEGEVYSNGDPFSITYTAFEWKLKSATTYRLSDRCTRPNASINESGTSRTSQYYDPVRETGTRSGI